MFPTRGALIVLEGCDRAGKSTQSRMLVTALNNLGIPAESRSFPDRSTTIGGIIDRYLLKKENFPAETVHLLFSANRWECAQDIIVKLQSGITLVVDRYAASGAAYTSAVTRKSLSWCKEPDRGLPSPDLVAYLQIKQESLSKRSNWGDERFEKLEIQKQVALNYEELKDVSWKTIDGNENIDIVHKKLMEHAISVINAVKNQPIGKLYET